MLKKRQGFASIMIFLAAIMLGMGVVGGLINTTWIEKARQGELERAIILWAQINESRAEVGLPEHYYDSVANVIWLDFIRNNVTPITNMIDFNRDVRRWNTQTKSYARSDAGEIIAASALNPDEEQGYRKYLRRVNDRNTGITWVIPLISRIPDETLNSGLRLREDALKVFLSDNRETRKYYPEDYITTRGEMADYYSDSHRETQDLNLMMPFSTM